MRRHLSIRRVAATAAGAVMAVAVSLVATASPASAHAHLETMNPGPGATVKDLPKQVVLTFSEDIRTPAFVKVTSRSGVDVASGDARIVDNTVTQTLGDPAGAGRYSVSYRITSADGHPVGGVIDFTVLSNAGAGGTTPADSGQTSPSEGSGGIGTTQLVLLLGVLVLGLAVLGFATWRALNQSVAMVEERRRTEETRKRGRSARS